MKNAKVKPVKLILDVRNRWNSLALSGKCFLENLPHVLSALKHKNIKSNLDWYYEDTKNLQDLVSVLEPAVLAVESLSRASINLTISEGIRKFLLSELQKYPNSWLATKFLESLQSRLNDRRDPKLASLVLYLENPNIFVEDHALELASKPEMFRLGTAVMKRIYKNPAGNTEERTENNGEACCSKSVGVNLHDSLKNSHR